ncbi:peptide deformylase [Corynebacterium callunae]|uniref:peptide deformylase n=1 Tax=Corynebacterium callunae TaxID=1721 RepID=UPI00398220CA
MTVRDVRLFGDPVLVSRAEEVVDFDETLATLIADMFDTMEDAGGVGLAANQVGVLRRVFVFDTSHQPGGMRGHVVNPVWEPVSEDTQTGNEGCLSIPNVSAETTRYETVRLSGQDQDGNPIGFVASGLLARCIQHETDHLDGVLFLKRLDPAERKAAMGVIRASDWFNN